METANVRKIFIIDGERNVDVPKGRGGLGSIGNDLKRMFSKKIWKKSQMKRKRIRRNGAGLRTVRPVGRVSVANR